MLLQLTKHDGTMEELEVLRSGFAREIATSFDWDAEWRRFEQKDLEESDGGACPPSLALLDDAGRVFEFGPNEDGTFWVSYRYAIAKKLFGFYSVEQQQEQRREAYEFGAALDLMELHYRAEHLELVKSLPPPEFREPIQRSSHCQEAGDTESALECLKQWLECYDNRSRDSDTLQGAMADAILSLRNEGNRNGWLNGGEFHVECIELLRRYLCHRPVGKLLPQRDRVLGDLKAVQEAATGGAFCGTFAYQELDRLLLDVSHWCELNSEPILREAGQDFW